MVLLSQGFNVALAEVQDLLPEHGAVLVAGSLLDGEVQQHHAPDEAEADQEEAQLLGGQLPQEGRRHADSTEGHGDSGRGGGGESGGQRHSCTVGIGLAVVGGCRRARLPHQCDFLL